MCIRDRKISDQLWSLLKEFSQVNFSVSFDGYKKINDYIRWGSDFDAIRANCYRVLDQGHHLAFQSVFSMYNATRMHEVFEFYDKEFPQCNTLVQPASGINGYLGPWHNPLRKQILESMYRCQQTRVCYNGGRNTSNLVEEVINRVKNNDYNAELLAKFFAYNDRIDRARGSRLGDYIPELEQARSLL